LILAAWKTVTVSAVCLLALLFSICSYSSKQYDIDSLSASNVGLRSALDTAMLQLQQTAEPSIELDSANAKIDQLQKQLTEAQSQLTDTQKQLDFANQRLDYLQMRNSNALKQFDYLKTITNH
jgi:DNA repair ATPase RecN